MSHIFKNLKIALRGPSLCKLCEILHAVDNF